MAIILKTLTLVTSVLTLICCVNMLGTKVLSEPATTATAGNLQIFDNIFGWLKSQF